MIGTDVAEGYIDYPTLIESADTKQTADALN